MTAAASAVPISRAMPATFARLRGAFRRGASPTGTAAAADGEESALFVPSASLFRSALLFATDAGDESVAPVAAAAASACRLSSAVASSAGLVRSPASRARRYVAHTRSCALASKSSDITDDGVAMCGGAGGREAEAETAGPAVLFGFAFDDDILSTVGPSAFARLLEPSAFGVRLAAMAAIRCSRRLSACSKIVLALAV